MQPTIMRETLLSQKGVLRLEPLDSETLMAAVEQELSIKRISGGMELDNIGIMQCAHRQFVGVMFCTSEFERPEETSMFIVDSLGNVIGREVSPGERAAMASDPNIIWLSDSMAIFRDKITGHESKFVISAVNYAPAGLDDGLRAVIYYPSVGTAKIINKRFGVDDSSNAVWTLIIGVDGLFPSPGAAAEMGEPAAAMTQFSNRARIGACGRCGGGSRSRGPPW